MRQPDTGAQNGHVAIVGQKVGVDDRCHGGIRTGQPHGAAAFRAQDAGVKRKPVSLHPCPAVIFQHCRDEVPLDVRRRRIGADLPEPASFRIRCGHYPGTAPPVFESRLGHAQRAFETVADEIAALCLPARNIVRMVLKVRADSRPVQRDLHPVLLEVFRWADPRQHQNLRGIESACCKDDAAARDNLPLLAGDPIDNADGAAVLDDDALHGHPDAHIQAAISAQRFHIGARGGPPLALPLRHLEEAEAFLLFAVEVPVAWKL